MGKKTKKKKGPSKRSKAADQRYVSKAELKDEDKKKLKALVARNIALEQSIDKAFDISVKTGIGKRFLTRLRNTARRRQMTPRQYVNAILVKPKGKK